MFSFKRYTGILFPVFFWSGASRVGTLHKTEAPKIPANPVAAIPASGLASFPVYKSEVFAPCSYFCPLKLLHDSRPEPATHLSRATRLANAKNLN